MAFTVPVERYTRSAQPPLPESQVRYLQEELKKLEKALSTVADALAELEASPGGGSGTVTSVDISGGTTGLNATGGPVTTSGTITLGGTLGIANGGTGSTTASGALTALGAYPASNPSGYIDSSALSPYLTTASASSTYLTISNAASTYLTSANAASTYLTIANAASNYQPLDGDLTAIAGLAGTSGLVKKTAANTYTLDTATYLTSGSALGTPASGTLTNCTGLPISTGVSGLGTNVGTFLSTPTSANLAAAVTDETGTGPLVFGTAPTMSDVRLGNVYYFTQAAQVTKNNASTLTITELLAGIIQYTGNAATLTLPTGTNIEGSFGGTSGNPGSNYAFEFVVINTGSGTCTIGTATGLTLTGLMTVASNTSGRFRVRRTNTNTYTVYRV